MLLTLHPAVRMQFIIPDLKKLRLLSEVWMNMPNGHWSLKMVCLVPSQAELDLLVGYGYKLVGEVVK